ncbi:MAG: 5'-nucleotidase C-terminal domain-containing protein [Spirochaetia bacterium]
MKTFVKSFAALLVLLLGIVGCATGPEAPVQPAETPPAPMEETARGAPLSIRIIHTNDHHSNLDGMTYDLAFEEVTTRLQLGGFARLATVIEQERTPNSIVLNSGELNGTLYFSLFKGEVDFKVFNYIGLDAYTLGNHEFDEGDARLAELIEMADFPIVSSNMQPDPASPLYRVRDRIIPYVVKEIDGQQVGIIGILKVEKTRNSSMVSDDVSFTPEIETAIRYVRELEAQGINKIILLSHVGYYNDIVFAQNVPGIDVIVGGDTHSLLDSTGELELAGLAPSYAGQTGPFPGSSHAGVENEALGEYPTTVIGPTGDPVHIVTAWEYAKGVGILDVEFDEMGIAVVAEGNIVLPVDGPFLQRNDEGTRVPVSAEVEARIRYAIERSKVFTIAQVSPAIDRILAPYRAEMEAMMTTQIGTISTTMPFTRIPEPFAAGQTPTGSYAAWVVAKAFQLTNRAIDVAIQNAGGVRTQFLEGAFTVGDAQIALPFSNTVVMLEMTGAEIVRVLNQSAWYSLNSGSTGAFPYAAGLRYDVDLGGGEDDVITSIEVQSRETGAWSPIDLGKVYTVATNSFTALGKDNYLEFETVREADPAKFEDTSINYFVPLKEYIEGLPGQTLPALDVASYCLKSVAE